MVLRVYSINKNIKSLIKAGDELFLIYITINYLLHILSVVMD